MPELSRDTIRVSYLRVLAEGDRNSKWSAIKSRRALSKLTLLVIQKQLNVIGTRYFILLLLIHIIDLLGSFSLCMIFKVFEKGKNCIHIFKLTV